eukprot:TRINITY_DN3965_c0_g1_i1.p2 TRINITY_DN3965_c0_g1~~TRINITY_DN3965_c0_g1_i1.p2  ORF type:complete len:121 (+),score=10.84 TRINITY_DN3965_c0_g1_i1:502-864(+)
MLEMVGRSVSRLSVLQNPRIQRRFPRKPDVQESLHLSQLFSLDRGLGFRQLIFREKAKRVLPATRLGSDSQRLVPRLDRLLEERVKERVESEQDLRPEDPQARQAPDSPSLSAAHPTDLG